MEKILVIDDDLDICMLLHRFLKRKGYEVVTANSGKAGIALAGQENPEVILTDFRLGDLEGSEVLQQLREKWPHIPVLVMTGYSDIRMAVNVMKQGALDYITKPIVPEEILLSIQKALAAPMSTVMELPGAPVTSAAANAPSSRTRTLPRTENGYVVGSSLPAQALYKQIDLVAPTNYSVIIYGESGSGKESVARMIHDRSPRRNQPFVAMDCGAISKDLANSELFGHEKGSFTGALGTKIGHFEMANGGTLFLDEVINLPYDVQVALLRVVQERHVKRIGSSKEIPLDVRIIVASNESILQACRKGKFREDLYHRFNEFSIEVPALRERRDDIMLFALQFLADTARELNKSVEGLSEDVINIFLQYPWYGNVRELKNVIKRATLLTDGPVVEAKSLPFEIAHFAKLEFEPEPEQQFQPLTNHGTGTGMTVAMPTAAAMPASPVAQATAGIAPAMPEKTDLKAAAISAEYEMIMRVLHEARFNKSKAAHMLGIDRKTLYNKLKNYNIE